MDSREYRKWISRFTKDIYEERLRIRKLLVEWESNLVERGEGGADGVVGSLSEALCTAGGREWGYLSYALCTAGGGGGGL